MRNEAVIGIPRGLLWYRYGILWQTFLESLGFTILLSPKTDKAIFDLGEARSSDEVCLASKIYLGHVASLVGRCDALFIPCHDSCNVRAGFCTKYQSLPDMVKATFRDEHAKILTLHIADAKNTGKTKRAFMDFAASELHAEPKDAARAWNAACKSQAASDRERTLHQQVSFALLEKLRRMARKDSSLADSVPLAVLIVAHPYVSHDEYVFGDILRSIEDMNAFPIYADECDKAAAFKRSFEFSDTLPWMINRELAGSILQNKERIDGVILVSAFPCGPDSMFDDAVIRHFPEIPILNLMVDSQSGTAGIQTRIESFMDILRFRRRGSYLKSETGTANG